MEEFIKRLSIETSLNHYESKFLIEFINEKVGNILTAERIYESTEQLGLINYYKQLEFGIIY